MLRKSLFLLFILPALAGCGNSYYSYENYREIPKIDAHIHINCDRGAFEQQAADDNFSLLTLNVDHGDSADIRKQFDHAVTSAERYPGRIFFGPTFLFDTAGWGSDEWAGEIIKQLEEDISAGAVTVKIWKNIGMTVRDRAGNFIMCDDPGLDPVIEYIEGKGLPVTGHLGEPRNCWLPLDKMTVSSDSSYFALHPQYHMFLHPEYPSYEDQINARDRMLERHPNLRFIGCHLGSLEWNVDSLATRLERFPNMAVDMSARICHLQYQSAEDRKKIRDFCIKYQDRLLYGTDVGDSGNSDPEEFKKHIHETWIDDWKYFATDETMSSSLFPGEFKGLKLPRDVIDKIYYVNAREWYNLPGNLN